MRATDDFLALKGPTDRVEWLEAAEADGQRAALHRLDTVALETTLRAAMTTGALGRLTTSVGVEWLLELGASRALHLNELLASTDTVSVRGLTVSEARRVAEVFGGSLDPATVRLHFTAGVQTMGAGALVLGNAIQVDPTDPRWQLEPGTTRCARPDDESWDSFNAVLLAHEPTHVWSYQHQGSRYAVNSVNEQLSAMAKGGSRNGAYTYRPDVAGLWDFGEEQRAMVVQDFMAATWALRRGQAKTLTRYGGFQPPAAVVAILERYMRELRGSGPGHPSPNEPPSHVFCPRFREEFQQDGALDALAQQADQVVAAAGRTSLEAVNEGLRRHEPLRAAVGLAGVAAAVTASVVSREQNGFGASGGGSALLDQAGLPHEVGGTHGPFTGRVRADWEAPAPDRSGLTLGFKDPRVTAQLGVTGLVGAADVSAQAEATVDRDGRVRHLAGRVGVQSDDLDAGLSVAATPGGADVPLRVETEAHLTSPEVRARAKALAELSGPDVQRLEVSAAVETAALSAEGEAHLSRRDSTGPLQLDSARGSVTLTPAEHWSVQASAAVNAVGLEAVEARVAAADDAGALSVGVHASELTTHPTVGLDVAASERHHGVSVVASAETTPVTGETRVGVGLKVPL